MKPKFACADFTFPLLAHDKVLRLIAMLDMDGVDIGLFEGRSHLQPSTEFADIARNAARLKSELDASGLAPVDVFLQCDNDFAVYAVNHPKQENRDFARKWYLDTLAYTEALGGRHVTVLPGVAFEEEPYTESFDRAVEELGWRTAEAEKRGITLGVEAHIGSLVEKPAQAEALVQAVEGLTLTLDYTHFERLGMPAEEYGILMPYASHFHARNAAPGQLQTIAEENTIDYENVVRSMIETDYPGYVGIEFIWMEWEDGNRVDNVSETLLMKRQIETFWEKCG
jgi:sugar phosphate isomerase/epimerase